MPNFGQERKIPKKQKTQSDIRSMFAKKKSEESKASSKSAVSKLKANPFKKKAAESTDTDEEVIIGVTTADVSDDEPISVEVEKAIPFSDGVVARQLKDLVIVPVTNDEEVDLLRNFLLYFALEGLFVGNISTKLSFMKKKGRVLL